MGIKEAKDAATAMYEHEWLLSPEERAAHIAYAHRRIDEIYKSGAIAQRLEPHKLQVVGSNPTHPTTVISEMERGSLNLGMEINRALTGRK